MTEFRFEDITIDTHFKFNTTNRNAHFISCNSFRNLCNMIRRARESEYETWKRLMTNTEDNTLTVEHLSYISNNTYYYIKYPCVVCDSYIVISISASYSEKRKEIDMEITCGMCLDRTSYSFYNLYELQNELKELKTIEI